MGLLLTVIGGWYINTVWDISRETGVTAPPMLALVALATIALIAGAVVSHIIIAVADPEGAEGQEDERDKQVLRRAGNISGYVLGFGCFAGLWHFFWNQDGNLLDFFGEAGTMMSCLFVFVPTTKSCTSAMA